MATDVPTAGRHTAYGVTSLQWLDGNAMPTQIKHTLQHFNVFPFSLGPANGSPDVIVRQHDLVVGKSKTEVFMRSCVSH